MSKEATKIASAILTVICVLSLFLCVDIYGRRVVELGKQVKTLQQKNDELQTALTKSNELIVTWAEIASETRKSEAPEEQVSRGETRGEKRMIEVTAYDLSYQSCQKYPDHPEYGITASGKYVEEWNTIAAGPELTFGTKVYIPYFKDKPNKGIFTVHDRGGGIKNGRIDVYMASYEDCMKFGRQQLEVYILE